MLNAPDALAETQSDEAGSVSANDCTRYVRYLASASFRAVIVTDSHEMLRDKAPRRHGRRAIADCAVTHAEELNAELLSFFGEKASKATKASPRLPNSIDHCPNGDLSELLAES